MQADVPVVSALYEPATHDVHTADVLAEPTAPKYPAAHTVHADVPVARALYAPAAQAVHAADELAVAISP